MKKLETRIDDKLVIVEVNHDKLLLDERTFQITQENEKLIISSGNDKLLVDDITQITHNTIRVELGGFTIDVNVQDPINLAAGGTEEMIGEIVSPMSGVVSEVLVKVGDRVKSGDTLMIISAMKMENRISSPSAGKITMVDVVQDEQIEVGRILLILE